MKRLTNVDLWSMAAAVIEMLTARLPWHDAGHKEAIALLRHIADTQTGPPRPEGLPDDLTDFLDKCFILDAEARPSVQSLLSHSFLDDSNLASDELAEGEGGLVAARSEAQLGEGNTHGADAKTIRDHVREMERSVSTSVLTLDSTAGSTLDTMGDTTPQEEGGGGGNPFARGGGLARASGSDIAARAAR